MHEQLIDIVVCFSTHWLQRGVFPVVLKGSYVHAGYEYTVGNSNISLLLKTHRMHMPIIRHCLHAWDSIKMMQETCVSISHRKQVGSS